MDGTASVTLHNEQGLIEPLEMKFRLTTALLEFPKAKLDVRWG